MKIDAVFRFHFTFVLILSLLIANSVTAQTRPDLSKINKIEDKLDAWRIYCNDFLGNYQLNEKLIEEAKFGLKITPDNQLKYKAVFNLFLGVAYENEQRYLIAADYFEKAVILAKKIKKTRYEITALSRLDIIYSATRNTVKRKAVVIQMKAIADTCNDLSIKQLSATALGGFYSDTEDYEKSIKYRLIDLELYKKALKTDTLVTSTLNIGYKLSNIGALYINLGRFEKALEYLNEAQTYIGSSALKDGEETLYNNYLQTYLGLDKVDSALVYYRRIYKEMPPKEINYDVITYANVFLGSYYLEKKETNKALFYTQKSIKASKSASKKSATLQVAMLYGKVLFQQKKYPQSIKQLAPLLNESYEFDKETLAELNYTLAKNYALLGMLTKAYPLLEKYSVLNSEIQIAQANKNFNETEAKYQNWQKTQQIQTKNLELKTAQRERFWLVDGLAMLVFVVSLLLFIYRNKKKTADILDRKNKELDVLNDNLSKANQTKARLFGIISHDLRSPISQLFTFLKLQQKNPSLMVQEQKEVHQKQLLQTSEDLLDTMENLLIWSKSQMESFEVQKETIRIKEILEETITLINPQAMLKQLTFQVNTLVCEDLYTDYNMLQVILRNLLQNAVANAIEGSKINLRTFETEKENGIAIANTTINEISPEKIAMWTSEASIQSKSKGYGLLIVKDLTTKIGAELNIVLENPHQLEMQIRFKKPNFSLVNALML